DILHGRSHDGLGPSGEHVDAVAVHDRRAGAVRPGQRSHLTSDRSDGNRPWDALELPGPCSGRDDYVGRSVASFFSHDSNHAVTALIDPDGAVFHHPGTQPLRVEQQRPDQPFRINRAFMRGPECTGGAAEPGPSCFHFAGVEPVGQVAVLSLPGHTGTEVAALRVISGDPGDSLPPKSDVDPRRLQQCRGERRIQLATGETKLQSGVVGSGLDLRGKHPGRRLPGLAVVSAVLYNDNSAAGHSQLPAAGSPYRSATDDRNIRRGSHLYFDETF